VVVGADPSLAVLSCASSVAAVEAVGAAAGIAAVVVVVIAGVLEAAFGTAAVVVVVTAGVLADFGGAEVPISSQFGADAAGSASGGTLVVVIGGVAVA